jgi:hypothetical protein
MKTKPATANAYPREVVDAFCELAAIQPPPGFQEYWDRWNRAQKKLEDACKKHRISPIRAEMNLRFMVNVGLKAAMDEGMISRKG